MSRCTFLLSLLALGVTGVSSRLCSAQAQYRMVVRDVVLARLHDLSTDNGKRAATIERLFAEAGCGNVSEETVKHLKQPNVICVLPGETKETIVVGAHLDKVALGTGAVDDWSGAALLPSLFQSLAGEPRKHTYVFIAFSGEEEGLAGSGWYVKHLAPEELTSISAMVNLECLGMNTTEVWYTHSDKRLVNVLVATARAMKAPISGVNVDNVGTDDSENFKRKHVPNITLHSVTQQTWHILHSKDDTLDKIDPAEYYDSYRLAAAYLAVLDTQQIPPGTAGSR